MINSKGESIYTNSEIAYEMGLSPATINAIAKRIFGGSRVAYWNLNEVKLIVSYIKSITIEEDQKRLQALHEVVENIMGSTNLEDSDIRKRANNDVYKVVVQ